MVNWEFEGLIGVSEVLVDLLEVLTISLLLEDGWMKTA